MCAEFRRDHPELAVLYGEISSFNATGRQSLRGDWPLLQTPEQLAALKIPTLFIAGGRDRVFPVEAIRRTQARVAGSFLVEIDSAGHSAFFERPREFNDSLLSFLQMCRFTGKAPLAHSNMPGYRPA
jgi:pimeloyl-ACP methyl ester carboxylesterase